VAVLPSGHDPAELLAERGRAGFDEILSSGRPDIDHLLRAVAPLPHTLDPRAQLDAIDRVLEALRPVKDRDLREGYLELSAEWFKVEGSRLRRRLAGDEPEELPEDSGPPLLFQPDPVEDLVLQLLIREPQLREQAGDVWELEPALIDDHWRPIAERLLLEPEVDGQGLLLDPLVRDDPPRAAALHRWLREGVGMEGQSLADPDRLCQEAIATLRTRWVDNRIEALQNLLTAAQREGDHVAAGQLFGELMELQRGRRGS
jgi:DNA primase